MTTASDFWGEPIHVYTRAQAIEDGVLIDLSATDPTVCRRYFKHRLACTAAVCAEIEATAEHYGLPTAAVLAGILSIFAGGAPLCRELDDRTREADILGRDGKATMILACGPGDNAEPVLTLMLPGED